MPDTSENSLHTLEKSLQTLRSLFHLVLVGLIVLTGSHFVYLLRELGQVRRQSHELTRYVAEYEKSGLPVIVELRRQLESFTESHPDFTPIFQKYFPAEHQPDESRLPEPRPFGLPD
jgi:hypothetical protein